MKQNEVKEQDGTPHHRRQGNIRQDRTERKTAQHRTRAEETRREQKKQDETREEKTRQQKKNLQCQTRFRVDRVVGTIFRSVFFSR